MVGYFAFEVTVFAKVGPSFTADLVALIGAVPVAVDAARRKSAIERSFKRAEGHFAVTVFIKGDEGWSDQIEMGPVPGAGFDDPLLADPPFHGVRHQPVSSSFGSRTRL